MFLAGVEGDVWVEWIESPDCVSRLGCVGRCGIEFIGCISYLDGVDGDGVAECIGGSCCTSRLACDEGDGVECIEGPA